MEAFASLPGIGDKTALRLALHMLRQSEESVGRFTSAIADFRRNIRFCPQCGMISDGGLCSVCADARRDTGLICVVESIRDVLSIENTGSYNGLYHVLGGIISPMDGIGPSDIAVDSLVGRIAKGGVEEVILALSTSLEGETTSFYICKKVSAFPVKVSAIARGVGFGDDLEYTDEFTLGRSITDRQPFRM